MPFTCSPPSAFLGCSGGFCRCRGLPLLGSEPSDAGDMITTSSDGKMSSATEGGSSMEARDTSWERSILCAAAEPLAIDPWTLIAYSHQRAAEGAATYGEVGFLERNLGQEALDEIADAANYLTWLVQKSALAEEALDAGTREDLQGALTQALRACVQLWDSTRTVNRLSKELGL